VLRLKKHGEDAWADLIAREIRTVSIVASVSPLPVPEVIAAAPAWGAIVVRKLTGTPLLDEPVESGALLVRQLAEFLSTLWALPVERMEAAAGRDLQTFADRLADARTTYAKTCARLTTQERRVVESFLDTKPPDEPRHVVFSHNDLEAEHLFASPDRTTLTGVIDWSDAAVTDPAGDIGRIYRDFGPAIARHVVAAVSTVDNDVMTRAAFYARCLLLEELAFGLTSGDPRYCDRALARLARTFAA
jgi:aminoglycoside phosphotransferase (APT) family kinase protein